MSSKNSKPNLPFSEMLADNLKDLYLRVFEKNKAALLIIDGGVGEGKTTLAVHCADYFNALGGLSVINLDFKEVQQLAMGGEDFAKKLLICHSRKLPAEIYDEAGDFNKRGALTRFNALINRTFETYRAFKVIVILTLPSMVVLDQDLFDKNIPRLLLHCYGRTKNQGNAKAYSLYRMMHIREKMKKLVIKSQAYGFVEPNFYVHFKNLTPERSLQLDAISTRGKIKELKHAEIKFEGLLSYSELANKVGRSEAWIKLALKELKINPVKKYERRWYFPGHATDALLNWVDDGGTVRIKKKGDA